MKRKLSLILTIALTVSGMFVYESTVYAETEKYESSYGQQLSRENSKEVYDRLVDAYIYKEGDAGNWNGIYTGLAKPVNLFTEQLEIGLSGVTHQMTTSGKTSEQIEKERNEWIQSATNDIMVDVMAGYDAFSKDYPEVFWMNGIKTDMSFSMYIYGTDMTICIDYVTIEPQEYYSGADDRVSDFNAAVINTKNAIVEEYSINETTEKSQIAKAIHDYLAIRLDYNYDAAANGLTGNYVYAFTPMPAFMDVGVCYNVVCEGYAKAFAILCNQFQIENAIVIGSAINESGNVENHMWNAVVPEDGNWYGVDVTWDDQKTKIYYNYFLTGQNAKGFYKTFKQDHIASQTFSTYSYSKEFVLPQISDNRYMEELVEEFVEEEVTTTQSANSNNTTVTTTNKVTGTTNNGNIKVNSDKKNESTNNVNKKTEVTDDKDSVTKKVKVTKVSIGKAKFKKIKTQKLGKKKSCKPKVKVTYAGKKLKKNKDYTVTYKNNKKKGTAKVIIKGKGKFKGKKVIKFKIK